MLQRKAICKSKEESDDMKIRFYVCEFMTGIRRASREAESIYIFEATLLNVHTTSVYVLVEYSALKAATSPVKTSDVDVVVPTAVVYERKNT